MSDCIFCKIASGEIPSEKLADNDDFFVIRDISPKAPIHILIISKKHIPSLVEVAPEDEALLGKMLSATKEFAKKEGIVERGWKTVINTGKEGGQIIPHLHIHLLGGKEMGE